MHDTVTMPLRDTHSILSRSAGQRKFWLPSFEYEVQAYPTAKGQVLALRDKAQGGIRERHVSADSKRG